MNLRDRLNKAYKGKGAKAEESRDAAANQVPEPPPSLPVDAEKTLPPGLAKVGVELPGGKGSPAEKGGKQPASAPGRGASGRILLKGGERKFRKAAKFLLLLGQEEAAKVMRHLKPDEIECISREIATIDRIDHDEADAILAEFGCLAKTGGYAVEGGAGTAKGMLVAAFGEEKANELFQRAVPEAEKPFLFLNDYEAHQLLLILKEESTQVMSVILPYLEPKLASDFLVLLPEDQRMDLVRRIARLEKVDQEILRRIEEGLIEKIRRIGKMKTEEVDGKTALANILRFMSLSTEEGILDSLEEEDPHLSESIREKLFTVDDILRVMNRDMQGSLRGLSEKDIALILKGKSLPFKEKLLSNVSSNRRKVIEDEYEILGPVRRDESERMTRDFVAYFKAKYDEGKLVLEGDEDLVD